jgi:hypothetical protein
MEQKPIYRDLCLTGIVLDFLKIRKIWYSSLHVMFYWCRNTFYWLIYRGETGLFPEAYVQEIFDEDAPPPSLAPPPLPQVRYRTV